MASRRSGPDASWIVEPLYDKEDHPRGGRSVFRARASDRSDSAILKVYDMPGRAQIEFDWLEVFSRKTNLCVRPNFVMPRFNLVAMGDLGDRTALDLMNRPETESAAMTCCLRWLRDYARQTEQGPAPFSPGKLVTEVRKELQVLPDRASKRGMAALAKFEAALGAFQGRSVVRILSFGDVKPSNICLPGGPDRPIAIDPVWAGPCPRERELAFLLQWCRARHWRRSLQSVGRIDTEAERRDRAAADAIFGPELDGALLDTILQGYLLQMWGRLRLREQEPRLQEYVEWRLGMHDWRYAAGRVGRRLGLL